MRVVMTAAAQEFIAPLTLQALSGHPVHTRLLDADQENAMGHINLARWADILLVAPASADIIAKFSHGLADDLLSTLYLAAACPIYIAPAMNQAMWHKAVTQQNIQRLQQHGAMILGPAQGEQACGESGFGRMLEAAEICRQITALAPPSPLHGKTLLITAGPTREPLDPVRYISNRSSGKMGYALAQAALNAGAEVILVSGPTALPRPKGATFVAVESALQMYDAVMRHAQYCDVYIGAAAVADYRPAAVDAQKIKKQGETMLIALEKNPDILAAVADLSGNARPFTVGFAAETQDLERYAQDKLRRKNLDMIAANLVGQTGSGFDSDLNALHVFWPDGQQQLPQTSKQQLAEQLIALIAAKYHEKSTS